MNKAVISPHAMKAPMFGMTIALRLRPNRWQTPLAFKKQMEEAENALKGGVTILQLREKNIPTKELTEKALKLKAICRKYNVPLIVNDDVRAAIDSSADGVHVGADDMDVAKIRKLAGVEEARIAQAQGADYLGCGALFASSTKQSAKPMTPDTLKQITSTVTIPVVAIGGLTYDNIDIISGCGVSGAAVVSAVFAQDDVKNAAEMLKEKIKKLI